VTGYCIRFKALKDINVDTLEAAIRHGLAAPAEKKGGEERFLSAQTDAFAGANAGEKVGLLRSK
jgi:hypothetical protein